MFDKELEQDEESRWITKRIKRLIRYKKIDKKRIYIFGVSIRTRRIIQALRKFEIEPVNILDNDKTRQNSHCARIKIISVDQVDNISDDENAYIISSSYWREMKAQLEDKNVGRENIHLLYAQRKPLLNHLFEAGKGKHVYNGLIKKYGNVPIFLCPYTGTGDIYLIGTFWKQYIEKNGIDNYIFVVVNGACKKVATLFRIKNIEMLKRRHSSWLLDFYLLCGQTVNIVVLNDSWPHIHTNQIEWFRGYKGLEFTEMFRRYVFHLSDDIKPRYPILENIEDELVPLFEKYHLVSGKTVILSPYSNTLADLGEIFWENLADYLKKEGYIVCTNSSGKSEPAISGTISVFPPLNIAPQFVSKAGCFIGVRSGFCDVISSAKAKKIILYDAEERFYNGSSFEYFSLERMGLCNDAIEIEYRQDSLEKMLSEIILNIN